MSMLLTKEVEISTSSKLSWYENKGYLLPKRKDRQGRSCVQLGVKIKVKTKDLPNGSSVLIDAQCDRCSKILNNISWRNYLKSIKGDGKYYCVKCAQSGYDSFISFEQWCGDNLSKEKREEVLSRWDYDLNIGENGNKLGPRDVNFSSKGLSGNGYWFKCTKHPEHGSELKRINNFTSKGRSNTCINCKKCGTLAITHPHLIKFLANKEDALKYSSGLKNILAKCPQCGLEKEMAATTLIRGFSCPRCSDGISYPEKFIFDFLKQLETSFKVQLTRKIFSWCGKYKYDFYIDDKNCIIETHGMQHYDENKDWAMSLIEVQENDNNKKQLAKDNGIKNYITVDCRNSELEWIKNSIMSSPLPTLLNFRESDIDWLTCHEYAVSSIVKQCSDLWKAIGNVRKISIELGRSKKTITNYLKQGNELGWCNYKPCDEVRKNIILARERGRKKVVCLTTNEVFNSLVDASRKYAISKEGVSACCRNIQKSSGCHPITGERLVWMYYTQ